MKHSKVLIAILCLISMSVGTYCLSTFAPIASADDAVQWQYRRIQEDSLLTEEQLNELGNAGWELADIRTPSAGGPSNYPHYYWFKRKKK